MKCYKTFRHESKRLHAIRIAHLIYPVRNGPKTWEEAGSRRKSYGTHLERKWSHLLPYCLLKADISRVYFLNPADLGRWGGYFLPWRIGNFQRSCMTPTKLIITTCSDEEVDGKLRDALCVLDTDPDVGQVEVLSWFGYSPIPPAPSHLPETSETGTRLTGAFRLLGTKSLQTLRPLFEQIAFIFLQHQSIEILTDVNRFFEGLNVLKAHLRTRWTPLLCGLLKGNIDGFVLLGKIRGNDASRDDEAEELISHLTDRALLQQEGGDFWRKVSAVAVYCGTAAQNDAVGENLVLLDRLPLPVKWT